MSPAPATVVRIPAYVAPNAVPLFCLGHARAAIDLALTDLRRIETPDANTRFAIGSLARAAEVFAEADVRLAQPVEIMS